MLWVPVVVGCNRRGKNKSTFWPTYPPLHSVGLEKGTGWRRWGGGAKGDDMTLPHPKHIQRYGSALFLRIPPSLIWKV